MAKLLQSHEMVYFDCFGLADAIYVISRKVDKHDMLRSILLRGKKNSTKLLILYESESDLNQLNMIPS